MNEYTRITVPLSLDEFDALRSRAITDYRHPRDQARHIIRQALGLTSDTGRKNSKRVGKVAKTRPNALAK